MNKVKSNFHSARDKVRIEQVKGAPLVATDLSSVNRMKTIIIELN